MNQLLSMSKPVLDTYKTKKVVDLIEKLIEAIDFEGNTYEKDKEIGYITFMEEDEKKKLIREAQDMLELIDNAQVESSLLEE